MTTAYLSLPPPFSFDSIRFGLLIQIPTQDIFASLLFHMAGHPAKQTPCGLLSPPPEVRRDIFTFVLTPGPKLHLYLQNGRPHVSPCLGANVGDETFEERAPTHELGRAMACRNGIWAWRMNSPWGNHYKCEEVRAGKRIPDHPVGQTRAYAYIFLVCRQMYVI